MDIARKAGSTLFGITSSGALLIEEAHYAKLDLMRAEVVSEAPPPWRSS